MWRKCIQSPSRHHQHSSSTSKKCTQKPSRCFSPLCLISSENGSVLLFSFSAGWSYTDLNPASCSALSRYGSLAEIEEDFNKYYVWTAYLPDTQNNLTTLFDCLCNLLPLRWTLMRVWVRESLMTSTRNPNVYSCSRNKDLPRTYYIREVRGKYSPEPKYSWDEICYGDTFFHDFVNIGVSVTRHTMVIKTINWC